MFLIGANVFTMWRHESIEILSIRQENYYGMLITVWTYLNITEFTDCIIDRVAIQSPKQKYGK